MSDAVLVVGGLARAELRARWALFRAFRDLDQVAELDGSKIDLDAQILEVGVDSATAEVGPGSGIVEVERDLSHRFLRSASRCGAICAWIASV
jgi:hypothetical protein